MRAGRITPQQPQRQTHLSQFFAPAPSSRAKSVSHVGLSDAANAGAERTAAVVFKGFPGTFVTGCAAAPFAIAPAGVAAADAAAARREEELFAEDAAPGSAAEVTADLEEAAARAAAGSAEAAAGTQVERRGEPATGAEAGAGASGGAAGTSTARTGGKERGTTIAATVEGAVESAAAAKAKIKRACESSVFVDLPVCPATAAAASHRTPASGYIAAAAAAPQDEEADFLCTLVRRKRKIRSSGDALVRGPSGAAGLLSSSKKMKERASPQEQQHEGDEQRAKQKPFPDQRLLKNQRAGQQQQQQRSQQQKQEHQQWQDQQHHSGSCRKQEERQQQQDKQRRHREQQQHHQPSRTEQQYEETQHQLQAELGGGEEKEQQRDQHQQEQQPSLRPAELTAKTPTMARTDVPAGTVEEAQVTERSKSEAETRPVLRHAADATAGGSGPHPRDSRLGSSTEKAVLQHGEQRTPQRLPDTVVAIVTPRTTAATSAAVGHLSPSVAAPHQSCEAVLKPAAAAIPADRAASAAAAIQRALEENERGQHADRTAAEGATQGGTATVARLSVRLKQQRSVYGVAGNPTNRIGGEAVDGDVQLKHGSSRKASLPMEGNVILAAAAGTSSLDEREVSSCFSAAGRDDEATDVEEAQKVENCICVGFAAADPVRGPPGNTGAAAAAGHCRPPAVAAVAGSGSPATTLAAAGGIRGREGREFAATCDQRSAGAVLEDSATAAAVEEVASRGIVSDAAVVAATDNAAATSEAIYAVESLARQTGADAAASEPRRDIADALSAEAPAAAVASDAGLSQAPQQQSRRGRYINRRKSSCSSGGSSNSRGSSSSSNRGSSSSSRGSNSSRRGSNSSRRGSLCSLMSLRGSAAEYAAAFPPHVTKRSEALPQSGESIKAAAGAADGLRRITTTEAAAAAAARTMKQTTITLVTVAEKAEAVASTRNRQTAADTPGRLAAAAAAVVTDGQTGAAAAEGNRQRDTAKSQAPTDCFSMTAPRVSSSVAAECKTRAASTANNQRRKAATKESLQAAAGKREALTAAAAAEKASSETKRAAGRLQEEIKKRRQRRHSERTTAPAQRQSSLCFGVAATRASPSTLVLQQEKTARQRLRSGQASSSKARKVDMKSSGGDCSSRRSSCCRSDRSSISRAKRNLASSGSDDCSSKRQGDSHNDDSNGNRSNSSCRSRRRSSMNSTSGSQRCSSSTRSSSNSSSGNVNSSSSNSKTRTVKLQHLLRSVNAECTRGRPPLQRLFQSQQQQRRPQRERPQQQERKDLLQQQRRKSEQQRKQSTGGLEKEKQGHQQTRKKVHHIQQQRAPEWQEQQQRARKKQEQQLPITRKQEQQQQHQTREETAEKEAAGTQNHAAELQVSRRRLRMLWVQQMQREQEQRNRMQQLVCLNYKWIRELQQREKHPFTEEGKCEEENGSGACRRLSEEEEARASPAAAARSIAARSTTAAPVEEKIVGLAAAAAVVQGHPIMPPVAAIGSTTGVLKAQAADLAWAGTTAAKTTSNAAAAAASTAALSAAGSASEAAAYEGAATAHGEKCAAVAFLTEESELAGRVTATPEEFAVPAVTAGRCCCSDSGTSIPVALSDHKPKRRPFGVQDVQGGEGERTAAFRFKETKSSELQHVGDPQRLPVNPGNELQQVAAAAAAITNTAAVKVEGMPAAAVLRAAAIPSRTATSRITKYRWTCEGRRAGDAAAGEADAPAGDAATGAAAAEAAEGGAAAGDLRCECRMRDCADASGGAAAQALMDQRQHRWQRYLMSGSGGLHLLQHVKKKEDVKAALLRLSGCSSSRAAWAAAAPPSRRGRGGEEPRVFVTEGPFTFLTRKALLALLKGADWAEEAEMLRLVSGISVQNRLLQKSRCSGLQLLDLELMIAEIGAAAVAAVHADVPVTTVMRQATCCLTGAASDFWFSVMEQQQQQPREEDYLREDNEQQQVQRKEEGQQQQQGPQQQQGTQHQQQQRLVEEKREEMRRCQVQQEAAAGAQKTAAQRQGEDAATTTGASGEGGKSDCMSVLLQQQTDSTAVFSAVSNEDRQIVAHAISPQHEHQQTLLQEKAESHVKEKQQQDNEHERAVEKQQPGREAGADSEATTSNSLCIRARHPAAAVCPSASVASPAAGPAAGVATVADASQWGRETWREQQLPGYESAATTVLHSSAGDQLSVACRGLPCAAISETQFLEAIGIPLEKAVQRFDPIGDRCGLPVSAIVKHVLVQQRQSSQEKQQLLQHHQRQPSRLQQQQRQLAALPQQPVTLLQQQFDDLPQHQRVQLQPLSERQQQQQLSEEHTSDWQQQPNGGSEKDLWAWSGREKAVAAAAAAPGKRDAEERDILCCYCSSSSSGSSSSGSSGSGSSSSDSSSSGSSSGWCRGSASTVACTAALERTVIAASEKFCRCRCVVGVAAASDDRSVCSSKTTTAEENISALKRRSLVAKTKERFTSGCTSKEDISSSSKQQERQIPPAWCAACALPIKVMLKKNDASAAAGETSSDAFCSGFYCMCPAPTNKSFRSPSYSTAEAEGAPSSDACVSLSSAGHTRSCRLPRMSVAPPSHPCFFEQHSSLSSPVLWLPHITELWTTAFQATCVSELAGQDEAALQLYTLLQQAYASNPVYRRMQQRAADSLSTSYTCPDATHFSHAAFSSSSRPSAAAAAAKPASAPGNPASAAASSASAAASFASIGASFASAASCPAASATASLCGSRQDSTAAPSHAKKRKAVREQAGAAAVSNRWSLRASAATSAACERAAGKARAAAVARYPASRERTASAAVTAKAFPCVTEPNMPISRGMQTLSPWRSTPACRAAAAGDSEKKKISSKRREGAAALKLSPAFLTRARAGGVPLRAALGRARGSTRVAATGSPGAARLPATAVLTPPVGRKGAAMSDACERSAATRWRVPAAPTTASAISVAAAPAEAIYSKISEDSNCTRKTRVRLILLSVPPHCGAGRLVELVCCACRVAVVKETKLREERRIEGMFLSMRSATNKAIASAATQPQRPSQEDDGAQQRQHMRQQAQHGWWQRLEQRQQNPTHQTHQKEKEQQQRQKKQQQRPGVQRQLIGWATALKREQQQQCLSSMKRSVISAATEETERKVVQQSSQMLRDLETSGTGERAEGRHAKGKTAPLCELQKRKGGSEEVFFPSSFSRALADVSTSASCVGAFSVIMSSSFSCPLSCTSSSPPSSCSSSSRPSRSGAEAAATSISSAALLPLPAVSVYEWWKLTKAEQKRLLQRGKSRGREWEAPIICLARWKEGDTEATAREALHASIEEALRSSSSNDVTARGSGQPSSRSSNGREVQRSSCLGQQQQKGSHGRKKHMSDKRDEHKTKPCRLKGRRRTSSGSSSSEEEEESTGRWRRKAVYVIELKRPSRDALMQRALAIARAAICAPIDRMCVELLFAASHMCSSDASEGAGAAGGAFQCPPLAAILHTLHVMTRTHEHSRLLHAAYSQAVESRRELLQLQEHESNNEKKERYGANDLSDLMQDRQDGRLPALLGPGLRRKQPKRQEELERMQMQQREEEQRQHQKHQKEQQRWKQLQKRKAKAAAEAREAAAELEELTQGDVEHMHQHRDKQKQGEQRQQQQVEQRQQLAHFQLTTDDIGEQFQEKKNLDTGHFEEYSSSTGCKELYERDPLYCVPPSTQLRKGMALRRNQLVDFLRFFVLPPLERPLPLLYSLAELPLFAVWRLQQQESAATASLLELFGSRNAAASDSLGACLHAFELLHEKFVCCRPPLIRLRAQTANETLAAVAARHGFVDLLLAAFSATGCVVKIEHACSACLCNDRRDTTSDTLQGAAAATSGSSCSSAAAHGFLNTGEAAGGTRSTKARRCAGDTAVSAGGWTGPDASAALVPRVLPIKMVAQLSESSAEIVGELTLGAVALLQHGIGKPYINPPLAFSLEAAQLQRDTEQMAQQLRLHTRKRLERAAEACMKVVDMKRTLEQVAITFETELVAVAEKKRRINSTCSCLEETSAKTAAAAGTDRKEATAAGGSTQSERRSAFALSTIDDMDQTTDRDMCPTEHEVALNFEGGTSQASHILNRWTKPDISIDKTLQAEHDLLSGEQLRVSEKNVDKEASSVLRATQGSVASNPDNEELGEIQSCASLEFLASITSEQSKPTPAALQPDPVKSECEAENAGLVCTPPQTGGKYGARERNEGMLQPFEERDAQVGTSKQKDRRLLLLQQHSPGGRDETGSGEQKQGLQQKDTEDYEAHIALGGESDTAKTGANIFATHDIKAVNWVELLSPGTMMARETQLRHLLLEKLQYAKKEIARYKRSTRGGRRARKTFSTMDGATKLPKLLEILRDIQPDYMAAVRLHK